MADGIVYLIGAGPGDEKLITVRGQECLERADVIVYDRLANPRLLRFARPDAEFIYCGKLPQHHTLRQETINELLVRKAQEGKCVARLKGGDPSVFGRVGEEAAELAANDVPFEIVPGITSGIAAPLYAGIPVTHREYGNTFALVTGHAKGGDGKPPIDWASLANGLDTIAFYMGVSNLPHICANLIEYGRSADTPVALIGWGTFGRQRTVTGTLATIVQEVESAGLTNPALTLVGSIVELRDQMAWFEKKRLFGRRILLARTGGEAGTLAEALLEQGADVVEYPRYTLCPAMDAATKARIRSSIEDEEILFTSPESVSFFFAAYQAEGLDIRQLRADLYALSTRTQARLAERGLCAAVRAGQLPGSGLIVGDSQVYQKASEYIMQGHTCDMLALYEKKPHVEYNRMMERVLTEEPRDTIIFPSAASVPVLLQALTEAGQDVSDILRSAQLVCMGPKTAEAVRQAGYEPHVITASPSLASLLTSLSPAVVSFS